MDIKSHITGIETQMHGVVKWQIAVPKKKN